MTTSTLTTADYDQAAEEKRARLRELTPDRDRLTHSVESRRNSIGAAIARGKSSAVAEEQDRLRAEIDELDGVTRAIEMLAREVADCVKLRKSAQAREAKEAADIACDQASQRLADLKGKMDSYAVELVSLAAETRSWMNDANTIDQNAKTIAGEKFNPAFPRVAFYQYPGLEAILEELRRYLAPGVTIPPGR
jgi:chromosome segregation ATPase